MLLNTRLYFVEGEMSLVYFQTFQTVIFLFITLTTVLSSNIIYPY